MEIWKPVPGQDGHYEVSSLGNVRSLPRYVRSGTGQRIVPGGVLKPGLASNGYLTVAVGKGRTRTVHSLVAEAFLGPCPAGMEVLHIDGTRTDNTVGNLRYGTRSDNNRDIFLHGRRKVTPEALKRARAELSRGVPGATVARSLGISPAQVSNIKNERQYK